MSNVQLHPTMLSQMPWLNFPFIQIADPDDTTKTITAKISGNTLIGIFRSKRRTAAWQAWAHFVGTIPPIPNNAFVKIPPGGFGSMLHPTAIFKGLCRPHITEEDGHSVLTYIINPTHTLKWHGSMVCCAELCRVPVGTVLAVYVVLNTGLQPDSNDVMATITGWEFVLCDNADGTLPKNYTSRYSEELWRRCDSDTTDQ